MISTNTHLSQLHFSWQQILRLCGSRFPTPSELSQFVLHLLPNTKSQVNLYCTHFPIPSESSQFVLHSHPNTKRVKSICIALTSQYQASQVNLYCTHFPTPSESSQFVFASLNTHFPIPSESSQFVFASRNTHFPISSESSSQFVFAGEYQVSQVNLYLHHQQTALSSI